MNEGINNSESRHRGAQTILGLFEDASRFDGTRKLQELVRGLGELFDAETTFIAHALDDPVSRVRSVAAWKDGAYKDPWEYELAGNPCQLTYDGTPTFIPCELASEFEKKKDSGYASYIGIPLKSSDGQTIGHIAIYASDERQSDSYALEIAQIAAYLAQAEIQHIITESKLQDRIEVLSEQHEIRGETVRTVAHDIRSPLSAVIGVLELAENDENPDNVSAMVSGAKEAAQRLLTFASSYLDLERLHQADTESLKTTQVAIRELVDNALAIANDEAMTQSVAIKVIPYDQDLNVTGSPQELGRVLSNLISNAVKYSPAGREVELSVNETNEHLTINVRDYGPGVTDDIKDCVFEAFKSGPPPAEHMRGSGLGLAIAKKIIDRHGGDIDFTNHDDGSTFFFSLPK